MITLVWHGLLFVLLDKIVKINLFILKYNKNEICFIISIYFNRFTIIGSHDRFIAINKAI